MQWSIPLGAPPEVAAIGRNAHGFEPMDRYCLPDLWSLHLYGYEAKLRIDDLPFDIRPGCLGLTPPGRTMETRYFGISVHIYVHFRALEVEPIRQVLAMQDLGDRYDLVYSRLYELVGSFADEPVRANARLWDLLWDLSSTHAGSVGDTTIHPAVKKATDLISRNLSASISVEDLAQEVGVSYSYLARLFQEVYGETVVGYLRNRRLERARHLLERSTLPIKAIAASVGIPDLQHFNKAMRARFGVGPRGIRDK
jgi:AraC family transcriptional regulator